MVEAFENNTARFAVLLKLNSLRVFLAFECTEKIPRVIIDIAFFIM